MPFARAKKGSSSAIRAPITGLRKAGREVTRSKNADDRFVYRLAAVKTAGEQ